MKRPCSPLMASQTTLTGGTTSSSGPSRTSVLGVLEGAHYLTTGKLEVLSEQEFVNCDHEVHDCPPDVDSILAIEVEPLDDKKKERKIEYTLLPDLAPHKIHAKIQVHVSRKCLFRGATDSGPLQHVDMVLSDREGNVIYAEIPGNLAEQKATNIEKGGVYDINRFRVCATKTVFKIVDGDKMIQFTFHTIVKRATSPPTTFPLYVYRLTSFYQIEPHVQTTNIFVDVLGVITEIHELTHVHVRSQLTPTVTRTIIIKDLTYYTTILIVPYFM
ncbi:Retrotransposon-like protein [Zea mays]|uniref:Retrotransposon-like protein n=1 Tax=Zea mays TaxID=4577 RepID=A0A1D6K8U4_MAIZE|nr:Retrotransposon-like protein [Zea mays]